MLRNMIPQNDSAKPSDLYQIKVNAQQINFSMQQADLLRSVFDPYYILLKQSLNKTIWQKLRFVTDQLSTKPNNYYGAYLWGSVGTGKTMLMELFYQSLISASVPVYKVHFNQFMRDVHDQLHEAGTRNPVKKLTQQLAKRYAVLCLDEFFVEDIADAMILAQLLNALLQHRVIIIITSNIAPDLLYANGLQRQKFMPAIRLLKTSLEVIDLDAGRDYRLGYGVAEGSYFYGDNTRQQVLNAISRLAERTIEHLKPGQLQLNQRKLSYALLLELSGLSAKLIVFDFDVLCGSGRSVRDYLLITRQYDIIAILELPVLGQADEDKSRRFIALIDEVYNQGMRLIIEAETDIDQIYQGSLLTQPFKRTVSRIRQVCATLRE